LILPWKYGHYFIDIKQKKLLENCHAISRYIELQENRAGQAGHTKRCRQRSHSLRPAKDSQAQGGT